MRKFAVKVALIAFVKGFNAPVIELTGSLNFKPIAVQVERCNIVSTGLDRCQYYYRKEFSRRAYSGPCVHMKAVHNLMIVKKCNFYLAAISQIRHTGMMLLTVLPNLS